MTRHLDANDPSCVHSSIDDVMEDIPCQFCNQLIKFAEHIQIYDEVETSGAAQ